MNPIAQINAKFEDYQGFTPDPRKRITIVGRVRGGVTLLLPI